MDIELFFTGVTRVYKNISRVVVHSDYIEFTTGSGEKIAANCQFLIKGLPKDSESDKKTI